MTQDSRTKKEGGLHLYGTSDAANQQPMPEQGMRGEQNPALENKPELVHAVTGEAGPIAIEETSGVAFAESSGAADAGEAQIRSDATIDDRED